MGTEARARPRSLALAAGGALVALGLAALYLLGLYAGWYGRPSHAGTPGAPAVPEAVVAAREQGRARAAAEPGAKQVLFGDLHVHTTFSNDAFATTLPLMRGGGAHPVADACDFARFCSGLDFWSVNDHAESLTPRTWRETVETIRACNAVAGDPRDPDVVAFLGWEWSQVGATPEEHYGHKNVVLRDLAEGAVPARPIAAAGAAEAALRRGPAVPRLVPLIDPANHQRYVDYLAHLDEIRGVRDCPEGVHVRELPPDCFESAATPARLFEKLDQWGLPALVIPHGTAWGFYTPPGTTWDNQLSAAQRGDGRQRLVEIHSGHGSSEEYRGWREVRFDAAGEPVCPEPTPEHLPNCWRAGEIVEERCLEAGLPAEECAGRAAEARANHVRAGVGGHLTVPGESAADWLDAGQCRDCFLPAFDYRPGGSVQYALARRSFEDPEEPAGFRFGFIGSSDAHKARPGDGYKEFRRVPPGAAPEPPDRDWRHRLLFRGQEPAPRSVPLSPEEVAERSIRALPHERVGRFMLTGALAAVHAEGRDRGAIWDAFRRRETYATSGDRILLWFHLENAPGPAGGAAARVPMGAEVRMAGTPRFRVRAVGAREQRPGCPEHAGGAFGAERLEQLCRGECHHPSERRKRLARIEVVRIRPQVRPDEELAPLIEDPWRVLPCAGPDPAVCSATFEDPGFAAGGRDVLYYVRAIQEPTPAVNADPLRCERDAQGRCVAAHPCPPGHDCLAPAEERAWSSPIRLTFARRAAPRP